MTYNEGQKLLTGALRLLLVLAQVVLLVWVVAYFLPLARDSTDGPWPWRSGMELRVDAETGCEYLEARGGGITPRMGANGLHAGCGRVPR